MSVMAPTPSAFETNERGISHITSGSRDGKLCLVCIHGWACQASDYSYLFNELLKQDVSFHGIAIDLPGHGKSSTKHYPTPSISAMVQAVVTLINDLRIKDVVLVGHSMGVRIIAETWLESQALGKPNIHGLVLIDGSHYKLRKTLFAFDKGDTRSKGLSNDAKIAGMVEAFKRMFSERTPADFQTSTLANLQTMNLSYNEVVRQGFIQYDYEEMDDALDLLGRSGIPLLSFQATNVDDQNHRRPLEPGEVSTWMQFVKEKVPQAQQVVVEDSMHFPHVDQPAKVAQRLGVFLEQLDADAI